MHNTWWIFHPSKKNFGSTTKSFFFQSNQISLIKASSTKFPRFVKKFATTGFICSTLFPSNELSFMESLSGNEKFKVFKSTNDRDNGGVPVKNSHKFCKIRIFITLSIPSTRELLTSSILKGVKNAYVSSSS